MDAFDHIRTLALGLPLLAKFAIAMAVIVGVPPLSRLCRLPAMVGLLLAGVFIGPHVLDIFGEQRPIAEFFADLGKLLLMFAAGLEIDLALFRRAQNRSILFGLITTAIPLLFGTAVGLLFGYSFIPAIVVGSLLASHTLLGLPIVERLGATRLEPVVVAIGATIVSDTLSLVVFAICVSTYVSGFSAPGLALQIVEIAVFVPLILFGLSRLGAYVLSKAGDDENAHFVLMLALMAVAGGLAAIIQLPDIVGAFLAGLAVNASVREKPAKRKLEFFAKSLFIPVFFVVTGFLIDPLDFFRGIFDDYLLVAAIIIALLAGKGIAAAIAGRQFKYTSAAGLTMWALTLPQVAATLAATLVAYDTFDAAGQRMIDDRMLNVVLVLMLATAILGPVLTERFAPRMLDAETQAKASKG